MTANFIILDAARMESDMDTAIELNPLPGHQSLYRTKDGFEDPLSSVAPYLFTFPQSGDFSSFILDNIWGNSWGVFIDTAAGFEELHHHFRRFLLLKTEVGQEVYFRFYDPRVLRIFLPTCDRDQLTEFFGPVTRFIMEDEGIGNIVIFSLNGGGLHTEYQIRPVV